MPVQLLEPLRLNSPIRSSTSMKLRWKGKQEANLFRNTATRGVDALVVPDVDQLADPTFAERSRRLAFTTSA